MSLKKSAKIGKNFNGGWGGDGISHNHCNLMLYSVVSKDMFRLNTTMTTFLTISYQNKDFHHLKQIC